MRYVAAQTWPCRERVTDEQMKDPYLLPFLLPNVFEISKTLSPDSFSPVLVKLQPLFILRDPPQNMLSTHNFPVCRLGHDADNQHCLST
jgi:hypothetical protein